MNSDQLVACSCREAGFSFQAICVQIDNRLVRLSAREYLYGFDSIVKEVIDFTSLSLDESLYRNHTIFEIKIKYTDSIKQPIKAENRRSFYGPHYDLCGIAAGCQKDIVADRDNCPVTPLQLML